VNNFKAVIGVSILFLAVLFVPPHCLGQETVVLPPPAASGFEAAKSSAPKTGEDSFKATAKTEILGQNLWEPLLSNAKRTFFRAVLATVGLWLFFILGPVFWTLAAMCGAAAAYWGAGTVAMASVMASKMPAGESMAVYTVGGICVLGSVALSWVTMLVMLVPTFFNAAAAVTKRWGGQG